MRGFIDALKASAEIVGLGWALGLASFTSIGFTLYVSGLPYASAVIPALALALVAVVVGSRVLRAARRDDVVRENAAAVPITVVGLGVAIAQVALAIWMALHSLFGGWDAWVIWAFKARMFAFGGPRPGYFHDPRALYEHPDYPLNIPLAGAALFRLPGTIGIHVAAIIAPACLASLLLIFFSGLTRLYGADMAALAVGALALVPLLTRNAALGYVDVPVAMYAGAANLHLVLWWRYRRIPDVVLMGLLVGGAIWTKKEGLGIAGLLLLVFIAAEASHRDVRPHERIRNMALACGAAVLLPLPWLIFSRVVRPIGGDFLPLTPAVFVANTGRIPHILLSNVLELLNVVHWSVLWVMLTGLLVLAIRRLTVCGRLLLLLLVGHLVVYNMAYVFSNWEPYTAHIDTSLARLVLQIVPLGLLLLLESIHSLIPVRSGLLSRQLTHLDRLGQAIRIIGSSTLSQP